MSQSVKERTGQTVEDDITELPQEYLDLERRVDGLKNAHQQLLKVVKAYEGNYDYPIAINESAQEIGGSLAHNLSAWAAAATKGITLSSSPHISTSDPERAHLIALSQVLTCLNLPLPR